MGTLLVLQYHQYHLIMKFFIVALLCGIAAASDDKIVGGTVSDATPPHSLLTSREVVPSCAEDHLLPQDTSSQLLTANTTSHPVLLSPSEMSPLPELNPLNKSSTLSNKFPMNNTAHPTNKTTS